MGPSPARPTPQMPAVSPLAVAVLVGAVGLAGCLPGAGRGTDRALSPADSASVAFAATVPVDTLELAWTARAPDEDAMPLPTSLGWLGDGRLAVVETQVGSVRLFGADGAYRRRIDLPPESFPYFAGATGDTVAVLARGPGTLLWLTPDSGVVHETDVNAGASEDAISAWAPSPAGPLWVRRGGGATDGAPQLDELAPDGQPRRTVTLPVAWRASGYLRAWGDRVVALSGYRPVLDLAPGPSPPAPAPAGARVADTLALRGFDSPQLARSAQFMRGDVDEPPLLTSSAAALGDALYVLNLRGDHVRIDVYGRDGVLQRVLVSPGPWRPLEHVAFDLAVRRHGGAVELAVLMQRGPGLLQPADAFLSLYRWGAATPESPSAPTDTSAQRPRS